MTPADFERQHIAAEVEPFGEEREDMRMAFAVSYLMTAFAMISVTPYQIYEAWREWLGDPLEQQARDNEGFASPNAQVAMFAQAKRGQ